MAKLGELEIEVVPDETAKFTNEVTEKPVENEANIGDHINHKPVEFTVNFVITGPDAEDKRDQLEKMSQSDEVFKYTDVKNYRFYENMTILDLNFDTNVEISNGYTGSISLKQIQIAEQQTATIDLGVDPATGEQVQKNAGETEQRSSKSEKIEPSTISPGTMYALFNDRGKWQPEIEYKDGDMVSNNNKTYICYKSHTSAESNEPGGTQNNWVDYWQTVK